MELIDSHCHLDISPLADTLEDTLSRARQAGVTRMITIGIDYPSSAEAVRLAHRHAGVFATVGLHPHSAAEGDQELYDRLAALARDPWVVAYGEIGLDYAKNYSPRERQLAAFAEQLDLAAELGLPVVIHDRDAHADTMRLLRSRAPFPAGGIMHCFSGDTGLAREVLDLGFYISIPGVVTFKNGRLLQEVVSSVPLDRMLLETDAPFLAPVPFRGKTNRPEYLVHIGRKVAELKGVSLEAVARQTSDNAFRLFNLPKSDGPHDQ